MKGFLRFTKNLMFVLFLAAAAFAQTETTQSSVSTKVGVVDTTVFYDKEKGIREIVAAQEKLEAEFKPVGDELDLLYKKYKEKVEEIEKLKPPPSAPYYFYCFSDVPKKIEEFEKFTAEIKKKQEEAKSLYEQRKTEIFADLYQRIGDAIKQFAKEKGYVIILDKSKDNSSVIIEGETFDVTEDFIKYYNENSVK